MLVINVELHSAITHKITTIARMSISNVGGTVSRGDYSAKTFHKTTGEPLRSGEVLNHPRISANVWVLVRKALQVMGY